LISRRASFVSLTVSVASASAGESSMYSLTSSARRAGSFLISATSAMSPSEVPTPVTAVV